MNKNKTAKSNGSSSPTPLNALSDVSDPKQSTQELERRSVQRMVRRPKPKYHLASIKLEDVDVTLVRRPREKAHQSLSKRRYESLKLVNLAKHFIKACPSLGIIDFAKAVKLIIVADHPNIRPKAVIQV